MLKGHAKDSRSERKWPVKKEENKAEVEGHSTVVVVMVVLPLAVPY